MEKGRSIDLVSAVVVFFVLLFVYTKLAGPIPFTLNSVNTNKTDLFQVSGSGEATAPPDTAKISVGVTESASSVLDAQTKVNSKAKKIIDSIKKLGVNEKDIKTTNYSVNPDYSFDRTQKVTGYTVSQSLEVKTDIDKINQVIDSSTSNGANVAGGIEFVLNDEKQLQLENSARKEAVEKAKKKAKGLAEATGIKLGRIIDVSQSSGQTPRPVFLESKTDQAEPAQPTNITPGESKIEVTITLTYQIL